MLNEKCGRKEYIYIWSSINGGQKVGPRGGHMGGKRRETRSKKGRLVGGSLIELVPKV